MLREMRRLWRLARWRTAGGRRAQRLRAGGMCAAGARGHRLAGVADHHAAHAVDVQPLAAERVRARRRRCSRFSVGVANNGGGGGDGSGQQGRGGAWRARDEIGRNGGYLCSPTAIRISPRRIWPERIAAPLSVRARISNGSVTFKITPKPHVGGL